MVIPGNKRQLQTILFVGFWTTIIGISSCYAQSKRDVTRYTDLLLPVKEKHDYSFAKENHSMMGQTMGVVFLLYKKFISSQDAASCVFHPSCSVYSYHSIQKNGVVIGLLDTFDRLSRCHKLRTQSYQVNEKTKKYIDPVG